jgi:hypothetical protein
MATERDESAVIKVPMKRALLRLLLPLLALAGAWAGEVPSPWATDLAQTLERTCFQTGQAWTESGNLRADVAVVYGIDPGLPARVQTWRDRGYRIQVMTGVSWGHYQDYLYGRFDGTNHEDEAQTDRHGTKISHGGDVYYMCPGRDFGRFLAQGVQRALDAGAEAIHLEEPEFWVRAGYSAGFKREWRSYYGEDWQPPHASVDAQWRASKLKYFLYRRALQQVFDHVQADNRRTGRHVRCYVPTHSLLNYAHWRIVSPESSLARLNGCDGYIAQVWTGTARTPNLYRGQLKERTFETAFLEYGAMQNLVRATGRRVWFLNDPVEDNPDHDWTDYRVNWESTLVASLFQPDVWRYEVAPWPERVFAGRYPAGRTNALPIPAAYATELQTVFGALNDMRQKHVAWHKVTTGLGLIVSDSLMFQRGEPHASHPHLSHVYGLALPLLKRGIPIAPVQLENLTVPGYLAGFRLLLLTYHGMKPLAPDVHTALADWVKHGGALLVCDDDTDPYAGVREWWNAEGRRHATPREHLFAQLGVTETRAASLARDAVLAVGRGALLWLRENPARLAENATGDLRLTASARALATRAGLPWRENNYLLLRRGPYLVAAGLDESVSAPPHTLHGRFVNLFDPALEVRHQVMLAPGARLLLLDLDAVGGAGPRVLASACKALPLAADRHLLRLAVEGVGNTPAVVLLRAPRSPKSVTLTGEPALKFVYSSAERLLWVRFPNTAQPRELNVQF